MIKAMIFDFGQTIADSAAGFREAEKKAKVKVFSYLGITSLNDFLPEYRRLRSTFHEKSEFSRKKLWCHVCEYFGVKPNEALFDEWETEYWDTVEALTELFREAIPTLEKLALKYRLALITNTEGRKSSGRHRFSKFSRIEKFFHTIIVAGEAGIPSKPHPAPFRLCLEGLGISPSEAVYVGDDWRIDIGGARGVGIQPIWIKHHCVERTWPKGDVSVPVIISLEDLLNIEDLLPGAIIPAGTN
jgi:putative hydrolase of the HAD superfamily